MAPLESKAEENAKRMVHDTLLAITRKYGVEKNLIWSNDANPSGQDKSPQRPYLKMTLAQFDELAKQVGYNERRVKILRQYIDDFLKVSTVTEYNALKRSYLKRYPEYLKNEVGFSEAEIQWDEQHPELVNLNTPGFQKARASKKK